MFNIVRKEIMWGGRKLVLETGKIARQATGSVVVTYGETSILCTVVAEKEPKPGLDFFPLSVHYQEKAFSVGKIPGGFMKREGKPSDRETLISRLIDRPIRPLFAEGFVNETQVVCTVLSFDGENEGDIAAIIGASAALTLSGVPFMGPVGAAKVALKDGEFILNPTLSQVAESDLELVVAGTSSGVLMVESEAKELSEEEMLKAVVFGHEQFQVVLQMIIDLAEDAANEPWDLPTAAIEKKRSLQKDILDFCGDKLDDAYKIVEKKSRREALSQIKASVLEKFVDETTEEQKVAGAFKAAEADVMRTSILKTQKRIDGRDTKTVRPIVAEVGFLPRTHGSALFTRGETQALVVATLGTGQDEQIIDAITGEYRETFMLHYNFPPFSVGEVGRMSSPGRREIGHGKLAWRAIRPLLPSREQFPYTLRVVSEITESNGSSSMATVCGTSLALMDAGVPLARSIAGIAMGLIKEKDDFAVLSDILGDEDSLGDMDFKVAGTDQGITALQMDIKITSITKDIMKIALAQAKDGRLHILGEMAKALQGARQELNENAPRIVSFQINKEKIRDVIGSGGKVIREICEVTGAKVDIDDTGMIKVASSNGKALEDAVSWIKGIVFEPEVGQVFEGKVVKIMDFGAFVNFCGRDGLVHISELAHQRVAKVGDVVNVGDTVNVKVIGLDDRGKIKLSMKALLDNKKENDSESA